MAECKAPFSRCAELDKAQLITAHCTVASCLICALAGTSLVCFKALLRRLESRGFRSDECSVATLWLHFSARCDCAYRKFFGFQDIAYGCAYGGRAVTSAAQFSSVRCGYLSAPLMGPMMGPVGRI